MITIADVARFLDEFAPPRLAAEWDNVGLLIGARSAPITRLMTCLTITPASAAEALRERAELIVTHHPFPFRPLKRITSDTITGELLLKLIAGGVGVHSPHTAFDSAARGINQQLAQKLALRDITPLIPERNVAAMDTPLGSGRVGLLPTPLKLDRFAAAAAAALKLPGAKVAGHSSQQQMVERVAIGCGSAGEFLAAAHQAGCQAFVTGEATFHTCLEAEALGVGLILLGHYASERFAVETLADVLAAEFPQLKVWPSRDEADPLQWVEAG